MRTCFPHAAAHSDGANSGDSERASRPRIRRADIRNRHEDELFLACHQGRSNIDCRTARQTALTHRTSPCTHSASLVISATRKAMTQQPASHGLLLHMSKASFSISRWRPYSARLAPHTRQCCQRTGIVLDSPSALHQETQVTMPKGGRTNTSNFCVTLLRVEQSLPHRPCHPDTLDVLSSQPVTHPQKGQKQALIHRIFGIQHLANTDPEKFIVGSRTATGLLVCL